VDQTSAPSCLKASGSGGRIPIRPFGPCRPSLANMGARRNGLEVETRVVSIFHFRDGQQTERWFYPDDAVAWNSIFGG
jgi:hypothetical protein